MNHDQVLLSFVTYLFLILSIILTILRCYTRFYLLKSSGADDILSICSMVRFGSSSEFYVACTYYSH
jgi:hypothetical protein